MRTRPLIVYGPPMSGKTTNAKRIAAAFGCRAIVDGWDGQERLPHAALAITNLPLEAIDRSGCDLYRIDVALVMAKIERVH